MGEKPTEQDEVAEERKSGSVIMTDKKQEETDGGSPAGIAIGEAESGMFNPKEYEITRMKTEAERLATGDVDDDGPSDERVKWVVGPEAMKKAEDAGGDPRAAEASSLNS